MPRNHTRHRVRFDTFIYLRVLNRHIVSGFMATSTKKDVEQSKSCCNFKASDLEAFKVGVTHVTVTVRNPAASHKSWDGLFLVDTGAVDSMAPGKYLRKIGLKPKSQRTYE